MDLLVGGGDRVYLGVCGRGWEGHQAATNGEKDQMDILTAEYQ